MTIPARASVCVVLLAAPFISAYACESPSRITMPDGYVTLDEAIEAQSEVRHYMEAMEDYFACLDKEIDAQSDPAKVRKLTAEYSSAIDEMETVASQFNDLRVAVQTGTRAPTTRVGPSERASSAEEGDTASGGSGSGVFGGIARAVAGIATGAGIAAAVTEGVPPEDAVELGMQVLGAIEGGSPHAQGVGTSSGATGSSLPSSTSASPAQSGANGTCEIPGLYDGDTMGESVMENLRLSWCPLGSHSRRRLFALQAELAWCRLNAEPPPESLSQFIQTSRRTCDSLAVLDEQARTATGGFMIGDEAPAPYVRCRCPAHYFQ